MVQGRISGRVLLPDGWPAPGAAVFLDAYFLPLGELDDAPRSDMRVPAQDEAGESTSAEGPPRTPHAPLRTETDRDGRYSFVLPPEWDETLGDSQIKVWATRQDAVASKAVLRVEDGTARVKDLVLGPAIRPRVKVETLDGAAVADAYVDLSLHVPDAFGNSVLELLYSLGARTDARGEAELPALPDRPDWHAWLHVNPRNMPRHFDFVPVGPLRTDTPIAVRISRGFTVRGRVLLPDGRPGSEVTISSRGPSDPDPNAGHSTRTSQDGSFELPGVPTKDGTLTFAHSLNEPQGLWERLGHGPWSPVPDALLRRTVNGREGGLEDLGEIRLPATLSIRGVVLDPAGRPAAAGFVFLDGLGMGHHVAPDGRFEIPGVGEGRHTLVATIFEDAKRLEGELKATLRGVEAGARDVAIRVTGGGNLVVKFHPLGKPNESLEVLSPRLLWGPFGGGGGERASEIRMDLKPGVRTDLRVEAEGYEPKMLGRVEILADRKTVIDVELTPGAR